jgi:hypothetical protein
MLVFILSGILYLVGVAIVLILKPSYMFTPDGNWKEFGIGQNEDRYTPFPFWLFCLSWALVSYFIVLAISTMIRRPSFNQQEWTPPELNQPKEMQKGYYVLNKKASKIAGVPKYVYLGPEQP